MDSLWSDSEARVFTERYSQQGVNEDLALRVYTTRLLGGDPRLVLHGGGNTSVKTTMTDIKKLTVFSNLLKTVLGRVRCLGKRTGNQRKGNHHNNDDNAPSDASGSCGAVLTSHGMKK